MIECQLRFKIYLQLSRMQLKDLLNPPVFIEFLPIFLIDIPCFFCLLYRLFRVKQLSIPPKKNFPFLVRFKMIMVLLWLMISVATAAIPNFTANKNVFWLNEMDKRLYFQSIYWFQVINLILLLKVVYNETLKSLNQKCFYGSFLYRFYSIIYLTSIFYFFFNSKYVSLLDNTSSTYSIQFQLAQEENLVQRTLFFLRFMVMLVLSIWDFLNPKAFYSKIYNEQLLTPSVLDNQQNIKPLTNYQDLYSTNAQKQSKTQRQTTRNKIYSFSPMITNQTQQQQSFSREGTPKVSPFQISPQDMQEQRFKYQILISDQTVKIERQEYFKLKIASPSKKTISKVERSYQQFQTFEQELKMSLIGTSNLYEAAALDSLQFPTLESKQDFHVSKSFVKDLSILQKMINIKRFCCEIENNPIFHNYVFCNFFKIDPEYQNQSVQSNLLQSEMNRSQISIKSQKSIRSELDKSQITNSDINLSSIKTQKERKYTNIKTEPVNEYQQYFEVRLGKIEDEKNYVTYQFIINSVIHTNLIIVITKRFSDFLKFVSEFKRQSKTQLPELPSKSLIVDEKTIEKRQILLLNWLQQTLNEKVFHSQSLFNFIGLQEKYRGDFIQIDKLDQFLSNVSIKVMVTGYRTLEIKESQGEPFVVYKIRVECQNKDLMNDLGDYTVERRFNDFHELNKVLKHRFKRYEVEVPVTPSKGFMVSNQERLEQLNKYLQKLSEYNGVWDSVCFRKFLKIDQKILRQYYQEKGEKMIHNVSVDGLNYQ